MQLPHWLILSGGLIVVVGLVGLVFTRNKDVGSDPVQLPEKRVSAPKPK
jgi:hypothetical protein